MIQFRTSLFPVLALACVSRPAAGLESSKPSAHDTAGDLPVVLLAQWEASVPEELYLANLCDDAPPRRISADLAPGCTEAQIRASERPERVWMGEMVSGSSSDCSRGISIVENWEDRFFYVEAMIGVNARTYVFGGKDNTPPVALGQVLMDERGSQLQGITPLEHGVLWPQVRKNAWHLHYLPYAQPNEPVLIAKRPPRTPSARRIHFRVTSDERYLLMLDGAERSLQAFEMETRPPLKPVPIAGAEALANVQSYEFLGNDRIAFVVQRTAGGGLYVADIDGKGLTDRLDLPGFKAHMDLDVSADGRYLTYGVRTGKWDVKSFKLIELDRPGKSVLPESGVPFVGRVPGKLAFSPNSQTFAYIADNDTPYSGLYMIDLEDPSNVWSVNPDARVPNYGYMYSPDSRLVMYTDSAPKGGPETNLLHITTASRKRETVSTHVGRCGSARSSHFSRDGEWFFFLRCINDKRELCAWQFQSAEEPVCRYAVTDSRDIFQPAGVIMFYEAPSGW